MQLAKPRKRWSFAAEVLGGLIGGRWRMENADRGVRNQRVRWVLFSGFGLAAGLATGLGLGEPIEALVGMMLVTPIVLAIAGSLLGTSQSLAMWRLDRPRFLWIAATALGLAVGMTLGIVAVEVVGRAISGQQVRLVALSPSARVLGLGLVGSITGLAVGLAQCLALRDRRAARRWVLLSTLGFGIGFPGGSLAADALLGGLASPLGFAVFVAAAGLITGAATASDAKRVRAALDGRRRRPTSA